MIRLKVSAGQKFKICYYFMGGCNYNIYLEIILTVNHPESYQIYLSSFLFSVDCMQKNRICNTVSPQQMINLPESKLTNQTA